MATTKFNLESKLKFHKIVEIQAAGRMDKCSFIEEKKK
jgi:hypothetical protein